jgi:hypothetical protein
VVEAAQAREIFCQTMVKKLRKQGTGVRATMRAVRRVGKCVRQT